MSKDKKVFGIGIYEKTEKYDSGTKAYRYWQDIIYRCYIPTHRMHKTYADCSICDEWIYFKNFAEWFDKNFYQVEGHRIDLDKDLLIKNNRIYSPETCIFLPHKINGLFNRGKGMRGDLPIGVHFDTERQKYRSCVAIDGKYKKGLRRNTIYEAFLDYKKAKESYIKKIAEQFQDVIPKIAYDAMIDWEVEYTD